VRALQHGDQSVGDGLAATLLHRAALAEADHAVVGRHDLADLGVVEPGYALHVRDNDGMERVVIKVRHNGPYKVTGPIRLIDADDNEYDLGDRGETIVLCRCGGSKTKPFCDSTHSQIGFDAAERAVREAGR
jgi:CDGSH iron-sulfur domain-containing protein 3